MVTKIKNSLSKTFHIGDFDFIYKKFGFSSAPIYAKKIIDLFNKNNSIILISGGFARDVLLNKSFSDIDFATNLNPDEIEKLLKQEFKSEYKKIELQGKTFGVIRIVFNNGENYEIATFRKDGKYSDGIHPDNVELIQNAEQDAKRRDFTINALFYNPIDANIVDYVGGLEDIKKRKLKFVGDPKHRIQEDKSRIIRYVRFLLQTGFTGDRLSEKAIINLSDKINVVPRELVKKELDKIIKIVNSGKMLEILDKLNLLKNIFPEIKKLESAKQGPPYHMEGDVFRHTKMVCENLPKNADPILKWVGIFHDIGKPESKKEIIKNKERKISFLDHEKIGIEKTKPILRRLKFSKQETKQIIWFIKNHLIVFDEYFLYIQNNNLKNAKEKITKSLKKLINESSEKVVFDLMSLALADIKGSIPLFENKDEKYMKIIFSCLEDAKKIISIENKKGIDIKSTVDGKFIMEYLGIKSGKTVGKIKNQIIKQLSDKKFESNGQLQKEFEKILEKLK